MHASSATFSIYQRCTIGLAYLPQQACTHCTTCRWHCKQGVGVKKRVKTGLQSKTMCPSMACLAVVCNTASLQVGVVEPTAQVASKQFQNTCVNLNSLRKVISNSFHLWPRCVYMQATVASFTLHKTSSVRKLGNVAAPTSMKLSCHFQARVLSS
jgi:hypothetical protein